MGGFTLTGPSYVIIYVRESMMACMCRGLHMQITEAQEDAFLNNASHVFSVPEFFAVLGLESSKAHVYEGDEEEPHKQMLRYKIMARNE